MKRNKLKDATNPPYTYIEKENKTINTLREYPEGAYPKVIAFSSGINVNTTKSILKKLERKGAVKLKEGLRGIYVLVDNELHGNIFAWNFHNTTLTCLLPDYTGERVKETLNFGLVNYEFEIGKETKNASMKVITNYPINISSICSIFSFFSLLIQKYVNYLPKMEEISLSCIEFNQDYLNLKFEGTKCITLTELLNQFKIYEKKTGIRAEYKLTIPIKAEAILSLLNNQTPSLSLVQDMNLLKIKSETIEKTIIKMNGLLSALLNKISPNKLKEGGKI